MKTARSEHAGCLLQRKTWISFHPAKALLFFRRRYDRGFRELRIDENLRRILAQPNPFGEQAE